MNEIMIALSPELEREIERLYVERSKELSKEEICEMLLELGIKKEQKNSKK